MSVPKTYTYWGTFFDITGLIHDNAPTGCVFFWFWPVVDVNSASDELAIATTSPIQSCDFLILYCQIAISATGFC